MGTSREVARQSSRRNGKTEDFAALALILPSLKNSFPIHRLQVVNPMSDIQLALREWDLGTLEEPSVCKCSHPPCGCAVGFYLDFCSGLCALASPEIQKTCPCGHQGCGAQIPKNDPLLVRYRA